MYPGLEKRSAERKAFKTPLIFQKNDAKKTTVETIGGTGVDISQGGLALKAIYPLEKGALLKVYVPVDELNLALPVYTEVIWANRENNEFTCGLRFLG
jgi:hypothetical protein